MNLLSAVADAAAAVLLFLAVTRWSKDAWAGLLAGGLFAFSPLVWSYAVAAEVFALNNLFTGLLLYLGARFQELPPQAHATRRRLASGIAFTLGLAVSNHHTIVLFGIPFGLWVLWHGRACLLRGPTLLRLAGLSLLGLLPYAHLPLAAASLPVMSWGDFSTASGFLDHFLRRDYGTLKLGAGETQSQLWTGLATYLRAVPSEVLFVGVGLAVWGGAARIRREGPVGLGSATALAFACYLLVFNGLANLPLDDPLMRGVVARFWQLPSLIVCAWAGLGLASAACLAGGSRPARIAVAAAAPIAVTLQLALHYDAQDQSQNYTIRDFGQNILAPLPPNALLISLGDLETNSVRYLQLCEGVRTDVRVLDRAMLAYAWTRPVVEANYPDVTFPEGRFSRRRSSLGRLIEQNIEDFPVFLSRLNDDEDTSWQEAFPVWPYGLVDRVVPSRDPVDLSRYLEDSDTARVALRSAARQDWDETSWERYAWSKYRDAEFQRGLRLLYYAIERPAEREPFDMARLVFEELAQIHPAPPPALLKNLGLTYRYLSDFEPSLTDRMVAWWRSYLQVAPASDAELPAIRQAIADAERRAGG